MSLSLLDNLRVHLQEKSINLSEYDLCTFVANVLLVQKGARLAYRIGVGNSRTTPLLVNVILDYDPSLACIHVPVEEPLLLLKRNQANVKNILHARPDDSGMAAVLGYTYRGKNWWFGDRYMIAYTLRYQETETSLYSFMIPMGSYSNIHRNQILHNLGVYCTALHGTGFHVEVVCFVLCAKQPPEPVALPTVG